MPLKIIRRKGVYYAHGTVNGERIRKSLGTSDPQIAAARSAEEEARRQRAAIYGVENEVTFAEACIQYLEQQAPARHYLVPIIGRLGKSKLAHIKPGQVKALARELYPKAKPQTWNRQVIAPVSAVLNHAHGLGLCAPMRVKRFSPQDEKIKQAIDRDWIDRFRAHSTSRYLAAYVLFIHTTAARPTEAIMLRPDNLDLDRCHGVSAVKTKTGSRREFWLTQEMADELKALPPKRVHYGAGELRVFGWAHYTCVYGPWEETCRRAGLAYVTPYEAGRHSFATEAITRQERNPVMVAKTGNWKNVNTLLRNYAHPEKMSEFVEQVYGRDSAQVKQLRVVKKNV